MYYNISGVFLFVCILSDLHIYIFNKIKTEYVFIFVILCLMEVYFPRNNNLVNNVNYDCVLLSLNCRIFLLFIISLSIFYEISKI